MDYNSLPPLERIEKLVEAVALVPLVREPKKARKAYRQDVRTKRRLKKEYRSTRKEQRAMEEDRLVDQYHKLKRTYKSKNWAFEMSLGEWITMWSECPAVEVGLNTYKPAWMLRGKEIGAVKLVRLDKHKPFEINNISILHGTKLLWHAK